jgi:hypothetical protein
MMKEDVLLKATLLLLRSPYCNFNLMLFLIIFENTNPGYSKKRHAVTLFQSSIRSIGNIYTHYQEISSFKYLLNKNANRTNVVLTKRFGTQKLSHYRVKIIA